MIAVVGTRGFPDVQGGVERHCEELYTRLAARGLDILVFTRSPYVSSVPKWSSWRGIRFRKAWTPRRKSLEALWHSVACVILARAAGAGAVHVHAIGPGLAVPLARALGLRVVFTHHGRDYMRDKWGPVAKRVLRTGERLAVGYAHAVLAVSREAQAWIASEYGRRATYAPNGIAIEPRAPEQVAATLAGFQLQPRGYAITVGRLVPEKRIHDLVEAISSCDALPLLVVVGDADHRSTYAIELKSRTAGRVRFLGAQPHGVTLDLVRGARVFVLPSYHEGLPIALLEAMASATPVVASGIAPHREIITHGIDGWLFEAGDVPALKQTWQDVWTLDNGERQIVAARGARTVAERFSWEQTLEAVLAAYREVGVG